MVRSIAARFASACSLFVALAALAPSSALADLTISSHPTENVACTSGVCTLTKRSGNLNVSQLQSLLSAGNVTVTANYPFGATDLVVSSGFGWVSGNSLTLNSNISIKIDRTIAIGGSGGLTLDAANSDPILFGPNGNITSLSTTNSLTINGVSFALVNSVAGLANAITTNPGGKYALVATYDAKSDGTYKHPPISTTFTGLFDGLGNTISNLTVVDSHDGYAALFAQLGSTATVRDLNLHHAHIVGLGSSPVFMGALAGVNFGNIFGCFASGHALGSGSNGIYEGGLVGQNNGIIVDSGADVAVSASANSVSGGLVGLSIEGQIYNSFSNGSVSASSGQSFLGGLVGEGYRSEISNAYATGSAAGGPASSVGGLVGLLQDTTVMTSYSTSHVSGGTSHNAYGYAGGFVRFDAGSNVYTDAYWDTTTSGFAAPSQGTGNYPNFPGITGLTTTQLQSGFPAGFNSSSVWAQSANINGGLPYLQLAPKQ